MKGLDISTLSLVALLTSLFLPFVLYMSGQFSGSANVATRSFMRGASIYALGFLLLATRGVTPDWIAFGIGNALILSGYAELAVGIRQFYGRPVNRIWVSGLILITLLPLFWTVFNGQVGRRVFITSIYFFSVSLCVAYEFGAAALRVDDVQKDRSSSAEQRMLIALVLIFLISAVNFLIRAVVFLNTPAR